MRTITLLCFLICVLILSRCEKKYDVPPLKAIESVNKINISQIKSKFNNGVYRFKSDSNLFCVVTADELSGNFYKELYVQDVTGALHVKLINSGGLYIGDSIRINLQNCLLNAVGNLLQLDSVDNDKNIVKLSAGALPRVMATNMTQILLNTSTGNVMQSSLVQINGIEFIDSDRNKPYADASSKITVNRIIKSCDGQTLTVRTSGYSNFASKLTPTGNGKIIGIVGQYGNTMQLFIRQISDVSLNDPLCSNTATNNVINYLSKNFNDNTITSGGWVAQTVSNTAVKWTCSSYSGTPTYGSFAKISGYVNGTNNLSESWLISPSIDLSQSRNVILNFETAAGKFAGPPLDILVSQDYNIGAVSSGSWTNISASCVLSPTTSNYVWTASGDVSLNAFKSSNVHVAFRYKSSTTAACTYELDNISIREK